MLNAHWRGRELGSCSDCWHYHEELRAGRVGLGSRLLRGRSPVVTQATTYL
jgi:hypothetical protein